MYLCVSLLIIITLTKLLLCLESGFRSVPVEYFNIPIFVSQVQIDLLQHALQLKLKCKISTVYLIQFRKLKHRNSVKAFNSKNYYKVYPSMFQLCSHTFIVIYVHLIIYLLTDSYKWYKIAIFDIRKHMHTCARTHTHTQTSTHTHAYTYIHTRVHTHADSHKT